MNVNFIVNICKKKKKIAPPQIDLGGVPFIDLMGFPVLALSEFHYFEYYSIP